MSITFLRIVVVLAAVFAVPQAARPGEAHWPDTLTIGTGSVPTTNTVKVSQSY